MTSFLKAIPTIMLLGSTGLFAENELLVFKKQFENGLVVLVKPNKTSQKVTVDLRYYVGSKDEKTGEKGLAHFLEHTVFQGTKKLSETDIAAITHKLSGGCNAATSYDTTHYYFDIPIQHWDVVLPILADCMSNCTFKQELLNSELKAVVQELKMYRDSQFRTLVEKMLEVAFPDHPYHNPIIGYKQDLWNLKRETLVNFYKKHYVPNNAVLTIVGNVDPQDVFKKAEEHFGSIPNCSDYKKEEHYLNKDLIAHTTVLYRDVKKPLLMIGFLIPGMKNLNTLIVSMLNEMLCGGKDSRLYKKLVDELRLVNSINAFNISTFDFDMNIFNIDPKDIEKVDTIIQVIMDEINQIIKNGIPKDELIKLIKKEQSSLYSLFESNNKQAAFIGEMYLATGDENVLLSTLKYTPEQVEQEIVSLLKTYFKTIVMQKGLVLPLPEDSKEDWKVVQQISDEEDKRILDGKIRELAVEEPTHVHKISIKEKDSYEFPKPIQFELSNGLKVFYYHNNNIPKINMSLNFKANELYDSQKLPGLYVILNSLLTEGTQDYPGLRFAQEVENLAIGLSCKPGNIQMDLLKQDLNKAVHLLASMVMRPSFDEKALEKIRSIAIDNCKKSFDNERFIARKLLYESIYKDHPVSKNSIGTQESIKKITRNDIVEFFKKYFTPQETTLVIVGDLADYDIKKLAEESLGSWQGPKVDDLKYPTVKDAAKDVITNYMNRDQIILYMAGLSVDRSHKDFDKLLLFNKIFGQGMNSRLFSIRQKTGICYTMHADMLLEADRYPGMVCISAIVSPDRVQELEEILHKTILEVADSLTQKEIDEAKRAIVNYYADLYSTNNSIITAFENIIYFDYPFDYYEKRKATLDAITLDEVKEAVKRVLDPQKLITIKVGRV